jgi:hypothetical protein
MYRTSGQMVAVPFILPPYFERIIESKGLLGYWCLLHFSVILQLYLAYRKTLSSLGQRKGGLIRQVTS